MKTGMRPLIMCAWLFHKKQKKRGYVDIRRHSPGQLLGIGRNPATKPRKVFTQLYLPWGKELDEDIAAGNG